jgi:hypothetical protein
MLSMAALPDDDKASNTLVVVLGHWVLDGEFDPPPSPPDDPSRGGADPDVATKVLPRVAQLQGYAGAYFDQSRGGELVVMFTGPRPVDEAWIRVLVSSLSGSVRFRYVKTTQAALQTAAERAWSVASRLVPALRPEAIAADTDDNEVRIEVAPSDVSAFSENVPKIAEAIDAEVRVIGVHARHDTACSSREACYSPMKAGIRVRKGSTTGTACTMGFHVVYNGDELFSTSGHCGYSGSNSWYHRDYGLVGAEYDTLYFQNGIDAMVVQMSDAQDSSLVYGLVDKVVSARDSVAGEVVCMSLGITNGIDCGNVADDSLSWYSDTADPDILVWGADASGIDSDYGDSGSPVYGIRSDGNLVAIGIQANINENFAEMGSVLSSFSMTIRTD